MFYISIYSLGALSQLKGKWWQCLAVGTLGTTHCIKLVVDQKHCIKPTDDNWPLVGC